MSRVLYDCVRPCIHLEQKVLNKGNTLEEDLKKIDKQLQIVQHTPTAYVVQLTLHIHHYSRLYFDTEEYMALVNAELNLPPASVTLHTNTTETLPHVIQHTPLKKKSVAVGGALA